jgi:hypothetical protein
MISSRVVMCVVGAVGMLAGTSALAQETMPETTPTVSDTSLGDTSRMRLGIVLSPMPVGTFKTKVAGTEISDDLKFAFGIMPTFDLGIGQFLFVGLAPQFIFNVKGKDSTGDAAKELDLRARVGGLAKVADTIRVFGYAAPGYSIIMFPNKPSGVDNPAGLVLGFAAGAMADIAPTTYLSAEIGYQLGFQEANSIDSKSNYLHIGVGLGFRI